MPYIRKEERADAESSPIAPGELNYSITSLAIDVLTGDLSIESLTRLAYQRGVTYFEMQPPSYTNGNAVVGAYYCAAHELIRRLADSEDVEMVADCLTNAASLFYTSHLAPYENKKIAENGDVFPSELL